MKTWKKRWRKMKRTCERLQSGVYQPGEYFPLGVPLLRIACVAKNCPKQSVKNKGFSSRMLLPLLLQLSVFQLGMCTLHHPRPPLFPLHSQWGTKLHTCNSPPPSPLWPSTFANQLKITIGTDRHQSFRKDHSLVFSRAWKEAPKTGFSEKSSFSSTTILFFYLFIYLYVLWG